MKSVFILTSENRYSNCGAAGCENILLLAFSTHDLAQAEIDRRQKLCLEHNYPFSRHIYNIEELALDEVK